MPTNTLSPTRPKTVIFFGSLWAQREMWQSLAIPPNAYLLVCQTRNKKHHQLMTKVAQVVKNKGRPAMLAYR